jgi:hypothetical protein
MICLQPRLVLGGFRQLGLVAMAESYLKTRDHSIVCLLPLISDILALGLSPGDRFRLFTPQIYTGLAGASLGSSKNPLPRTRFPKFSFPLELLSQ